MEVESFNAVPGRGITAIIDGKSYVAGNIEMMRDNSIKVPDSVNGNNLSQEGKLLFTLQRKILSLELLRWLIL